MMAWEDAGAGALGFWDMFCQTLMLPPRCCSTNNQQHGYDDLIRA